MFQTNCQSLLDRGHHCVVGVVLRDGHWLEKVGRSDSPPSLKEWYLSEYLRGNKFRFTDAGAELFVPDKGSSKLVYM